MADIDAGAGGRKASKSPDAFRTISEVASDLDVPQHVLRFWESKFSQIKPMKRGGGRRYYRPEDVDLLRGIRHLLYTDGYTIKGVQKLLREIGAKTVMESGRSLSQGAAGAAAQSLKRSGTLQQHTNGPDLAEADDTQKSEIAEPPASVTTVPGNAPKAVSLSLEQRQRLTVVIDELMALKRILDGSEQA